MAELNNPLLFRPLANETRAAPIPGPVDEERVYELNPIIQKSIILKGSPTSQLRIALVVLSNETGQDGWVAARPTDGAFPKNARNLEFTIKYKYYQNTIERP